MSKSQAGCERSTHDLASGVAKLRNLTVNQHFISQSEQRLNAIDHQPHRIFAFSVTDERESFGVTLESESGIAVKNNLSFDDLFSFDVQDRMRLNLEECFQRYENGVAKYTTSLLDKLTTTGADIKDEFINLFAAKFLNFLRNPFCVKKVLNILGDQLESTLDSVIPTDPDFQRIYQELSRPKPHQELVLREFELSLEHYQRWLRALFLMVAVDLEGRPVLDHLIHNIITSTTAHARVFRFSEKDPDALCLLSDRGANDLSSNDPSNLAICWEFNLTSRSFIRIALIKADSSVPTGVDVDVSEDDYAMLTAYNRNAVYQCARRVYCAGVAPLGIRVQHRTR